MLRIQLGERTDVGVSPVAGATAYRSIVLHMEDVPACGVRRRAVTAMGVQFAGGNRPVTEVGRPAEALQFGQEPIVLSIRGSQLPKYT
jgi:hypothetical protein